MCQIGQKTANADGRRPEPYGGGHMAAGNRTAIRDVAIKETYQLNADVWILFAAQLFFARRADSSRIIRLPWPGIASAIAAWMQS